MKSLLILLSLLILSTAQARGPAATAASAKAKAASADSSAAKSGDARARELLKGDVMKDIKTFAQKKLDPKKDQKEVDTMVHVLLALDDEDPSRTGVMMLSQSYGRYPAMYDKAFKSAAANKSKAQKEQLLEIKSILKDFDKKGNGDR